MLMICNGASGLGSMKSAVNWSPVLALSTTQTVTCVLVAQNITAVAYLQEWDEWRQNGVSYLLNISCLTHACVSPDKHRSSLPR